jgi:hypothetical protein
LVLVNLIAQGVVLCFGRGRRENPAETIEVYDGIVKVILRGRVLERAALAANEANVP